MYKYFRFKNHICLKCHFLTKDHQSSKFFYCYAFFDEQSCLLLCNRCTQIILFDKSGLATTSFSGPVHILQYCIFHSSDDHSTDK